MSKTTITDAINANILTGGHRTSAANTRSVLEMINAESFNINDTTAGALTGAEKIPLIQDSVTKQVDLTTLATFFGGGGSQDFADVMTNDPHYDGSWLSSNEWTFARISTSDVEIGFNKGDGVNVSYRALENQLLAQITTAGATVGFEAQTGVEAHISYEDSTYTAKVLTGAFETSVRYSAGGFGGYMQIDSTANAINHWQLIAFNSPTYNFVTATPNTYAAFDASRNLISVTPPFHTDAGNNFGFGTNTFSAITTGQFNEAHGDNSLNQLTSGSNNVAIGDTSGYQLTTGNENVFIGHDSYVINKVLGAGYTAISCSIAIGGGSRISDNNQFVVGGDRPGINDILNTYIGGGVMNTATDLRGTTIQTTGVNVGDSNGSAVNSTLTIAGARGTGTGLGGDIIFKVATAGASGSTQNPLTEVFRIKQNKLIQYQDGFQGAGKVLTSDASGVATWQPAGGVTTSLASGYTYVGNGYGVATATNLTAFNYRLTFVPNSTAVAIVAGVDPTNRITITAWSQSSGSGSSYGDGLRLIAEHGRTKLGIKFWARGDSAKVISANTQPFAVTTGQTLTLKVDGGSVQTITFSSGITSGAATSDEIANYISSHITGAQAINLVSGNLNPIQISSDSFGILSTIEITGGTANTGLGFPLGINTGIAGTAMGDGQTGIQKAWLVCHDKPNDLTSANRHGHISLEVSDSTGAMQTRLGIEYDLDNTRITISSAQFIVNENAIIVSAGSGSNKEFWFASDNSGQQHSRLWLYRVDGTAAADWRLIAVDDSGVTDTLMIGKRLLSTIWMDSAMQFKQGSSVARQTTLNPLMSGGNTFTITGTGTTNFMRFDSTQTGAYVYLFVATGQIFAHQAASPGATALSFDMRDGGNYTVPANGAYLTFYQNGSFWKEVDRIEFSNTTGTGAAVYATSPTLITPILGVASATSINKVIFTAPATTATLTLADNTTTSITGGGTLALGGFTLTALASGTIALINGTGFVKASGTTLSYDNSTYLTTSSASSTYAPINNPTFTGTVTLAADPLSALQAATKSYVDNYITGISWKQEVKAATTANITLSGTQTIDGIALIAGDRCLVKNQSTSKDNGIYLVAAGAWTRTTDADTTIELETAAVLVRLGTVNADTQWTCTNSNEPVIGTDAITFGQIAGVGTYTNGTGITLTGNVFSIAAGAITNTMIASMTSANLATIISDETGSGVLVFATSPTFTTNITTPQILGGTGASSAIEHRSTSGTGTTTVLAHSFTGGTNGATTIASLYNDGQFLIGTSTTRNPTVLGLLRVTQGTSTIDIGEVSSGVGGIWMNQVTPSTTNFVVKYSGTSAQLNGSATAELRVANVSKLIAGVSQITFGPGIASSGALPVFDFAAPASTAQTLSTEAPGIRYVLTTNRQWATGALTTQREILFTAPTYRFVGASTISDAATLAITGAPIASTNATITRSMALWVQAGLSRFDGGIMGVTDASSAASGVVGETITSTISTYTNYTTTATYQAITSVSLTAGDWEITVFATLSSNTSTITAASNAIFVVSTTTASATGSTEGLNIAYIPQAALLGTSKESISFCFNISISSTTSYFLNSQATFTVGNPQFVGTIKARRLR